jgi:hypothetical protein
MPIQPVQPIGNDMSNPYRFQIYFQSKKKGEINALPKSKLTKDTVEISKEGMELYLNSNERLQMKTNLNTKEIIYVEKETD